MKRVILGLGSNKSFNSLSPVQLLDAACEELKGIVFEPYFSSIYTSKAMYVTDQEDFYNMVCIGYVADDKNPYDFLDDVHKIESKYGRDRSKEIRFGPRTLDVDIEEFGNLKSDDPVLLLPHPRIKERAFVLIPLLELLVKHAEDLQEDIQLKDFSQALANLHNQDEVVLFRKNS
ncbi:MAG: 2-amino-4-hydroxy-6-hydroxymethyldihydropteridine diphosphokinase [Treponema sp.]|nr:2-amino-4-hydroxy-6-hydroxymethyldihydropteridine diphosphokinase [Treponema sp.]